MTLLPTCATNRLRTSELLEVERAKPVSRSGRLRQLLPVRNRFGVNMLYAAEAIESGFGSIGCTPTVIRIGPSCAPGGYFDDAEVWAVLDGEPANSEQDGGPGDSDPAFAEVRTSLKYEPGASASGFRWDRILGIVP